MARPGWAGQVAAGLGNARFTIVCWTRQAMALYGGAGPGAAGPGKAGHDRAGQDKVYYFQKGE